MSGLESEEFLAHSSANCSDTDQASQGCGTEKKKLRRREKNRIAAQRSRKKQTLKADELHEEYEGLEQENIALKREIRKLSEEVKHLSDALKDHEGVCPMIHCTMNFVTSPRPHSNVITGCLSCEGQSGVS
ncbi:basic leucine zipper transcriptional factor ATF-like 3 [Amblyraja radiata]|uniref:basic leucine zipper transcriptional factor ATF-like 3 n=1 Tax=Amblyraja radiata TaxID=386614 RepID=UPI0014027B13|nr:basic leucine zipper transcriptional factor ATF-like 3 [Amblyraja radiata]